jgi:hypothetical protein
MPSNLVKTKSDEKYWDRAKEQAADALKKKVSSLKDDDYALVTHIFKKMTGEAVDKRFSNIFEEINKIKNFSNKLEEKKQKKDDHDSEEKKLKQKEKNDSDEEFYFKKISDKMLEDLLMGLIWKIGELEGRGDIPQIEDPNDMANAIIAFSRKLITKRGIINRIARRSYRFGSRRVLRKAKSDIGKAIK